MFEALLAKLAKPLDAADLPYMIIGGQAVLLYGAPRLTQAVDPSRLADVLGVVEDLGLTPLVEPEPFVTETLVLAV